MALIAGDGLTISHAASRNPLADLDEDGRDEVIVGCNRPGGLQAFDHAGVRLWKNTEITTVSLVTAGDFVGDKKKEVISATGVGDVHIVAANGNTLKELNVGFDLYRVGTFRMTKDAAFDTMIVAGSAKGNGLLATIDGNGKIVRVRDMPSWEHNGKVLDYVYSMAVCPNRPWAAFSTITLGSVNVVDCRDGSIIADAGDQGFMAQVAWATPDNSDQPILLIASARAMSAFQVKPSRFDPDSKQAK